MLLLSILYRLVRWLLGLIAVLMWQDLSKDAELLVLRHENARGLHLRENVKNEATSMPATGHRQAERGVWWP